VAASWPDRRVGWRYDVKRWPRWQINLDPETRGVGFAPVVLEIVASLAISEGMS